MVQMVLTVMMALKATKVTPELRVYKAFRASLEPMVKMVLMATMALKATRVIPVRRVCKAFRA